MSRKHTAPPVHAAPAVPAAPDIRAVDLFCGVGGLTHGLEQAGIAVAAGVDVDPACSFPFEANNKARFVQADVNGLTADTLRPYLSGGTHSLLAGCAPCQPFSTYSRSGRSLKRPDDWSLASRFGDLVQELQPDLVTMENVPQIADHPVFEEFVGKLDGYAVWWSVVQLSTLGVPQSRKRLVLLASRLSDTAPQLPDPADAVPVNVNVRSMIEHLRPLTAGAVDPLDRLHTASRLSPLNLRRIRSSKPGGTWRDWDEDLRSSCHVKASGQTYPSVYGRMEWDKVSPTITTQCFGYGNGRFGHPEQDRAISLREAAILQTFPPDYAFVDDDEPVKFATLGRLIGNAVPVRLGEVVGEVLVDYVTGLSTIAEPAGIR